jgi:hypothetical protein
MSVPKDSFKQDIQDVHLIYDYDAHDPSGNPEKWRYEMWFYSEVRRLFRPNSNAAALHHLKAFGCRRTGSFTQSTVVRWLEDSISRLASTSV